MSVTSSITRKLNLKHHQSAHELVALRRPLQEYMTLRIEQERGIITAHGDIDYQPLCYAPLLERIEYAMALTLFSVRLSTVFRTPYRLTICCGVVNRWRSRSMECTFISSPYSFKYYHSSHDRPPTLE